MKIKIQREIQTSWLIWSFKNMWDGKGFTLIGLELFKGVTSGKWGLSVCLLNFQVCVTLLN
jgi:hypothetical protein